MSKDIGCAELNAFKKRIEAGENPDDIIPYCINIKDPEEAKEFLFYAKQVLKDPHRLQLCEDLLKELTHESR